MTRHRLITAGVSLAILAFGVLLTQAILETDPTIVGRDFGFYRSVGERWLADGTYYLPRQMGGPYELALMVDVLYPPTALALFVPLALLPLPLAVVAWWGLPVMALAYLFRVRRPSLWAWPVIVALLVWPRSLGALLAGNTDLTVAGFVAAGLLWGWPAVLALMKPSFALLALVGVRRRSWWIAVGVMAALSMLALPLWVEYVVVLRDVRGLGVDYSIGGLPLLVLPLVAWLGARLQLMREGTAIRRPFGSSRRAASSAPSSRSH